MYTLVFECPKTKLPILSGVRMEAKAITYAASMPVVLACHCGSVHHVKVRDAKLVRHRASEQQGPHQAA
jgi:hypothetical protein